MTHTPSDKCNSRSTREVDEEKDLQEKQSELFHFGWWMSVTVARRQKGVSISHRALIDGGQEGAGQVHVHQQWDAACDKRLSSRSRPGHRAGLADLHAVATASAAMATAGGP
ncbi:unnamed protein product [Protopolystoma xenopodis]|uniref:Uncharacterized protein n=1 Tax=Protopolystoma xenopodis TaxID=117903 RepID=A0A448X500_9PLAT|nr:unnamed protein product [Protopolystoma xenopodis]